MPEFASLFNKINYSFTDYALLEMALTHRSRGVNNYERVEFLGDSILGFVVAEWLYKEFPECGEGKLSRMRATVVRKETLANIARKLDLGDYLLLGEGELKSGGFNRDSILSDTLEGIIGAIYIESGITEAKKFILEHFMGDMKQLSPDTTYKDPKSHLQELMQQQSMTLPEYTIIEITGEPHEQEFTVRCFLPDLKLEYIAKGRSRRVAEQTAANMALVDAKGSS